MAKVSFTVSARTARLIGRENISNSKGAIIELVKNASDADSKVCIIFIDIVFEALPQILELDNFNFLVDNGLDKSLISKVYNLELKGYSLIPNCGDESLKATLLSVLKLQNSIYIIDAGEGMTKKTILDNWMTIGTANKEYDILTQSGRVKAGAKGIGRFALDKLGDSCQMITKFSRKEEHSLDEADISAGNEGYEWAIDWRSFDNALTTIDNVKADLNELKEVDLIESIKSFIADPRIETVIKDFDFQSGTILKVSHLRENWHPSLVDQVYSDLEVLVPPQEFGDFAIYLFDSRHPEGYGEVTSSTCDDYDYKLSAITVSEQTLKITIQRNEIDLKSVDPAFFSRKELQNFPYTKQDFENGYWEVEKTLSQLLPGFKSDDKADILSRIGAFEFYFYYMKRTYSSPDAKKFWYKPFSSQERKVWLNKYGGIKVFRDNFRVRPYGEINNTSFDWLGLGSRKSKSPAAPSRGEGGYKVEPDNVSGIVKISRANNSIFEDKSSREGLLDSRAFYVLQRILIQIIRLFEDDRAFIAKAMDSFDSDKNFDAKARKEAEKLATSLLARKNNASTEQNDKSIDSENSLFPVGTSKDISRNIDPQLIILAELNNQKNQEIEQLKDEQKVLRGLASSGIVIASFTHDLSNLNQMLGSRITELQELLEDDLPSSRYNNVENFLNPYVLMKRMKEQDEKMQSWLKFSLSTARKDKRKIKNISLPNYFSKLKETWLSALEHRHILFEISDIRKNDTEIKIFELDLDSIFNNLIVNSIDAFMRHKKAVERQILITIDSEDDDVTLKYQDNGPGLSLDIDKPERIFEALFTTKRNHQTGEEEGTGIGMWLVKSIVIDNKGDISLFFPTEGFGLSITLPLKQSKA